MLHVITCLALVFLACCGDPAGLDKVGGDGEPAAELIQVKIVDPSGAPISDATVVFSLNGADRSAATNQDGVAAFEVSDRARPIDVHVFAHRYGYRSAVGLAAADLTIEIYPLDGGEIAQRPEVGSISGTISGWNNLPEQLTSNETTFSERIALVEPIGEGATWIEQLPREDSLFTTNIALGGVFEDFAIRVDAPRTTALIALGGLHVSGAPPRGEPGPGGDPTTPMNGIRWTHLGVLLDPNVAAGARSEGRNIELTHPLITPSVELRGVPAGLTMTFHSISLLLPDNRGVATIFDGESGQFLVPELRGELAGGQYRVSATAAGESGGVSWLQLDTQTSPIVAQGFLQPPLELAASNRTLSAQFVEPGVFWFNISGASSGGGGMPGDPAPAETGPHWNVITFDASAARAVRLPEVPEGFADPLRGRTRISATVFDLAGEQPLNLRSIQPRRSANRAIEIEL